MFSSDTPGGSIGPTPDPSFSIHHTNKGGLASNFSSVEHHIATTLPNILLLSETQLSSTVSPDSYQISHYNFLPRFRFEGGVCAYYNITTPVVRLMDLESPDFDVYQPLLLSFVFLTVLLLILIMLSSSTI